MTTTCQICEREVKSKFGVIAHHGYTRPEMGWQTDSCMGARHLPYEKSRDIIPEAINYLKLQIEGIKNEKRRIDEENLPVPFLNTFVKPEHSLYNMHKRNYFELLEGKIRRIEIEIERLQNRYNSWREQ